MDDCPGQLTSEQVLHFIAHMANAEPSAIGQTVIVTLLRGGGIVVTSPLESVMEKIALLSTAICHMTGAGSVEVERSVTAMPESPIPAQRDRRDQPPAQLN